MMTMKDYTLFIVDDERTIREGIAVNIEDDYCVFTYKTAEEALENLGEHDPDLVLLDIGLPGMNGIQALKQIKAIRSDLLVIMITAYEDINSVIECMKNGAYEYIIKPIQMEGLEITIANALQTIRLRKEIQTLQEDQIRREMPCFIGESQVIHDIMGYIEMVAKSPDTPILIQGETGTGKELIASTIHHRSPNFAGPFIAVNCAAIPNDLIESELFGYEKGAFSGASVDGKKGLIEMADKGTLFLDEIGDLNPDAQAKLLRFMEEGEFYKVGGTIKQKVHTRIVSATNKNLEKMIAGGKYRKDLFYRIGVVKIQVPSLNERGDDVLLFADFFLQMFKDKFKRSLTGISEEALELLKLYTWSGNVRELRNMVERAVLTAKGAELSPADLGLDEIRPATPNEDDPLAALSPLSPAGIDLNAMRFHMDKNYFSQAMALAKGNETRAAKLLNLKPHTFRYQYKKNVEAQETAAGKTGTPEKQMMDY
jgi:DNA-binding NtrC family response regulator